MILVVEDNDGLRDVLARFLRLRGCEVEGVANGIAAVAAIRRRVFDVVVSDLAMPWMDGAGLWLQVRRSHPDIARRWVFATAEVLPHELAASGLPYIRKPFELDELWNAVRAVLGR